MAISVTDVTNKNYYICANARQNNNLPEKFGGSSMGTNVRHIRYKYSNVSFMSIKNIFSLKLTKT